MARDAQGHVIRDRSQDQGQETQSTTSNEDCLESHTYNRRETLLEDPEHQATLRIWELKDLSVVSIWSQAQREAALQIQEQMMEDYDHLQEVIQAHEQTMAGQAAVVKYLENEKSKSSTTRNRESHQKSTKIPDPPTLTEGIEPAYDDWSIKIKMKLEANLDHFPTPALQMGYVQSRLGGKASSHINPRLRSTQNKFQTVEEMFEVLDRVFKFQRLTVELDYSEETLIDDLCHKVNTKMQTALIAEINPSSLHAFAQKCLLIRISSNFKSKTLALSLELFSKPLSHKTFTEGRCFHCQQTGHRAYECPTKNAQVHEVSTYDAPTFGKRITFRQDVPEGVMTARIATSSSSFGLDPDTPFIVTCMIGKSKIKAQALIDTGATGGNFVNAVDAE
ncbi:hypothetical protein VC83_09514 [Pseudogymnoascus destructans]|uniref:CCHC-type domain-containing protein n=1 Tax=Pseudogymnoascus destructans TaxID=655981 RepID=A0A176ZW86_9PEZI|nr:uncharacterized protein VC83_09514 [Pseudogymnoascus destructans]OAF54225.1 hypothetical protein VC83_09514 [Pseudogymnoascus destructans]